MPNYKKILKKAVEEDARKGKTTLRTLSFPEKVKTKKGEHIHKLPPTYPMNQELEDNFKKDYSLLMKKFVIKKIGDLIK